MILSIKEKHKTNLTSKHFVDWSQREFKELLRSIRMAKIKEDGTFDTEVLPKIMKSFLTENELGNVVDYDYFTAKSFLTGKIVETERTFAVHNFAG